MNTLTRTINPPSLLAFTGGAALLAATLGGGSAQAKTIEDYPSTEIEYPDAATEPIYETATTDTTIVIASSAGAQGMFGSLAASLGITWPQFEAAVSAAFIEEMHTAVVAGLNTRELAEARLLARALWGPQIDFASVYPWSYSEVVG